jgi:hypothetical protein
MAQYDVLVAQGGLTLDRPNWIHRGRIEAAHPLAALRAAAKMGHAVGEIETRRKTMTTCSATLFHKSIPNAPVLKVVNWA